MSILDKIKDKVLSATLGLYMTAAAGCGALTTHHEGPNPEYKGPKELPTNIEQRFRYRDEDSLESRLTLEDTKLEKSKKQGYYDLEVRTFESYDVHLGHDNSITFEYYGTKVADNPPFVMVAPILGGHYTVSRMICELLAENGISAAIVYRKGKILKDDDYPNLETGILSMVSDRRKVLDLIVNSGEVDAERMGSFGISMGAITNVPLIAVDDRLDYHIFGLPGGDIPSIMRVSSERQIEKGRVRYMQRHGLNNLDEFEEHLRKGYKSDPLNMAPYIDARNVRMFLAYFDTVVPIEYGLKLRDAMGKPELNVLPTGHYTTALYFFWISSTTLDFFEDKFKVDTAEVTRQKRLLYLKAGGRRNS